MRQLILTISCICIAAALCEQLLAGNRYFPVIRMALGLELAAAAAAWLLEAWKLLNL